MRAATLLRELAAFKAEEYSFNDHRNTINNPSSHQQSHPSSSKLQSNHPNGSHRPTS